MNDLDRIEHALETKRLDPALFERCAQDLLTELFPGLSPIPGGSDWGRDADISVTGEPVPARLLATSSRSLDGVRKNMRAGIASMQMKGVEATRLVLANPASLSRLQRQKLVESAHRAGMRLDPGDIFDRGFFASRLRRDGYWRKRLLGLPSAPISLSRLPVELAESAWGFLPVVAREGDLNAIRVGADTVITGPPGVGKSRLAAELDDAVFVDHSADLEQVANDLRWAQPAIVVVDDAGGQIELVGRLLWLRRAEPDIFSFRLVATCWPDDRDAVCDVAPEALVHELDLLERSSIDELIQAMGVTSDLARSEILDQAEGRPGWAITLTDLLLRASDAASLLQGKALLGQVNRYLRRAAIGSETVDILAIVAALGSVSELEIGRLATAAEVTRATAISLLSSSARGGLVDIHHRYSAEHSRELAHYMVRPPMLAKVVVAERMFDPSVPSLDFDSLCQNWPDHVGDLALAALRSALLGADSARPRAATLFEAALADAAVEHARKIELASGFLQLGVDTAERVVELARQSFDQATTSGDFTGYELEPLVDLAARAVRWYQLESAIELLLDASLVDTRATNPYPNHPLRQIGALVSDFHPEVSRQPDIRFVIATHLQRWLDVEPEDAARSVVAAGVLSSVMTLHLHGAHSAPGSPRTIQLFETVVPAAEMRRMFDELAPVVAELLTRGSPDIAASVVEVASDWLRVGSGYDKPFGRGHDLERIGAAKEIGVALIGVLADAELDIGTRLNLRSTAEHYDIDIIVEIPSELEPFFSAVDTLDDWRAATEQLEAELKYVADRWSREPPADVIARLVQVRADLARARLLWPDRPAIAARQLADNVTDPLIWLTECERHGFLPEGCAFARRAMRDGALEASHVKALLETPSSRAFMLAQCLTTADAPEWAIELALAALASRDFELLRNLTLQEALDNDLIRRLLTETKNSASAMVAVALLAGAIYRSSGWPPDELEQLWLSSLLELRASDLTGVHGYEFAQLFTYLAARYPKVLAELVVRTLREAEDGAVYRALPHDAWETLHVLPAAEKVWIWQQCGDRPICRMFLQDHLVGADIEWLTQMIDANLISPEGALGSFRGFGHEPPIAELAKLLVPRGVDPVRVAGLRFSGSWSGDESERYKSIVESFRALEADTDVNVRLVADAGVRIFSEAAEVARTKEQRQRVRGER